MKKLFTAAFAMLFMIFSFQQLMAYDFTVSGQVLATEQMVPVPDQEVKLHIHQTQISETAFTAEDGTYTFTVAIPDSGSFHYVLKTFDECIHHYIIRNGDVIPEGATEDFVVCQNGGGGGQFGCEAGFNYFLHPMHPLKVMFHDESDFLPGTWAWDFGDGETSSFKHPQHTYAAAGEYTVTLTINGADSTCVDTYSELIVVEGGQQFGCEAAFTWNTHPHHPLKVMFHDESDFLPGTWAWDFGDGETSSFKHPQHTYAAAGEYTVTLTINGADSTCVDTYSETVVVEGNGGGQTPCEAKFIWHESHHTPYKVYFHDKSEFQPGTWYWEFGDGETSTDKNPQHIFAAGGEFTVTLSVVSADSSCVDTYSEVLVIEDLTMNCEANFWWHHNCQNQNPLEIKFHNNSYTFSPIVELAWDFGDGTTSGEEDPVHVYGDFGLYTVTLGIVTESGCESSKTLDVWVHDPAMNCMANFVPFIDSINPLQVFFQDLSLGDVDSWLYDFGDGTTSDEQNPVHIYPEATVYTASLTIEAGDCTSSFYYEIDLINGQVVVSPGPTTGVNEISTVEVSLWPNPVQDVLYIRSDADVMVTITNLAGQVLITTNQKAVDVSGLTGGVYFAVINVSGQIVNRKFIK